MVQTTRFQFLLLKFVIAVGFFHHRLAERLLVHEFVCGTAFSVSDRG